MDAGEGKEFLGNLHVLLGAEDVLEEAEVLEEGCRGLIVARFLLAPTLFLRVNRILALFNFL